MRAARANLRKVWSDAARAAAAAARAANAKGGAGKAGSAMGGGAGSAERASAGGAFTPGGGETVDQARAKANAYIAAHPDQFKPKGAKGAKGKAGGKGAGKKAADPAAAKAKAAKEAQAQAEHAQRQKEHAEDRAQRQADRAQRQKEHAQAQAEHEQLRAEHEADRQARLKAQADKAKASAAKAKAKASAGGSKKSGGGSKKGNQFTEAAHQLHIDAVNAKANARNAKLMGQGSAPVALTGNELSVAPAKAKKMAKVAANISAVLEQTGLAKRDISTKTRNKMDDSSFVFPDTKSFPIQKPEDVDAAVRSWGRYKGPHSFADFKRNLTRIAHKKGFALPEAWNEQTQKRARQRAIEAALLAKADLPDLARNAEQSLRKYL